MLGILFYRKLMQNSGIAEFGNRVKQGIYSILKKCSCDHHFEQFRSGNCFRGENICRVSLNCRIIKTIFVNCLNLAGAWGRNYVYSIRPTKGTKTL